LCLTDFLACALEAFPLGPSHAARRVAELDGDGPATVIGSARRCGPGGAAFANAVAGHGLVREDMHAAAVSHLGVVVLPTLLALAQTRRVDGQHFMAAASVGYEVGARLGRALVNPAFSRQWRPTGFTGPLAAAAAGARLLRLDAAATASALALAANTASGLNEWPRDGGEDMFFHPGFAARNALAAVMLAEAGAYGSAGALDGPAGLFAAARSPAPHEIALFPGAEAEVQAVFRKALPLCNFAQTPAQAALRLRAVVPGFDPEAVAAIAVHTTEAAVRYPGCDATGPFDRVLQAKMSIPFCVAAALLHGAVVERHFTLPAPPSLLRLAALVTLEATPAFTAAFPARQGAAVAVVLRDGSRHQAALDAVEPADAATVQHRFGGIASQVLGDLNASRMRQAIDDLSHSTDAGALMRLAEEAEGGRA
jgi:2-methylcitrate dehydratase PrpD